MRVSDSGCGSVDRGEIIKMARRLLAFALVGSAAAFVAPQSGAASSALHADATCGACVPLHPPRRSFGDRVARRNMDGIQAPTGYFDPLGIASKVNDKTLLWFRAAEIKRASASASPRWPSRAARASAGGTARFFSRARARGAPPPCPAREVRDGSSVGTGAWPWRPSWGAS